MSIRLIETSNLGFMDIFLVVIVGILILLFYAKRKLENNDVIPSGSQEKRIRNIVQQETVLNRKIIASFEDITSKIYEGKISNPPDIYADYRYHAFDRAMKHQGFLVSDAVVMLNNDMQHGAEEKMRQALFYFYKENEAHFPVLIRTLKMAIHYS